MKTSHFSLFIVIALLMSCKSSETKKFDAKKFDASTIKSTSLDARHLSGKIYIMKDTVVVYPDTIR